MLEDVLIVGGGPAGLMAAEAASEQGLRVLVVDAKPSLGRKFLMAGRSGLNLTNAEPLEVFLAAYDKPEMRDFVRAFPPDAVRDWADRLGAECFVGSSGKLFPKAMKASPLLRAWIAKLENQGVRFLLKTRWIGTCPDDLRFQNENKSFRIEARAVIFALGGASWPRLGSDGAWAPYFPSTPLLPDNMGFDCDWSPYMEPHAGAWLKNIALTSEGRTVRGEVGLTKSGIEGGAVYALSQEIAATKRAWIDLLPNMAASEIAERANARGKMSMAKFLHRLGLSPAARALYFECPEQGDVRALKALELPIQQSRPIEEAISTAGGVRFDALDGLMLRDYPSVFVAGEMLDWRAPTGGYLLTGCFASGRAAALQAVDYLNANSD